MKLLVYNLLLFFFLINFSYIYAQSPKIDWSTYYGGELTSISSIKYSEAEDCIYIIGNTADTVGIGTPGAHISNISHPGFFGTSPTYPLPIKLWPAYFFISKFDMNGNRIWGTYWGGTRLDYLPQDVALDTAGNIIISGITTNLSGLATSGAYITESEHDSTTYFLAKISKHGVPMWTTYMDIERDSSTHAKAMSIEVDNNNNIYVAGIALKNGLATMDAIQPSKSDYIDLIIMRFDEDGNRDYATYYTDGSDIETIMDFKIDKLNQYIYFIITTDGIEVDDEVQGVNRLIKYKISDGSSTSINLHNQARPVDIEIDGLDNVYVIGYTTYSMEHFIDWDFINDDAFRSTADLVTTSNDNDMFLVKFDKNLNHKWGTYYGGDGVDGLAAELLFYEAWPIDQFKISADNRYVYFGTSVLSHTLPNDRCGIDYTYKKGALAKFDSSGQYQWGGFYDAPIAGLDIISQDRFGNPLGDNVILIASKTDKNGLATPGSFKDSKDGLMFASMITKISESCPLATPSISYASPSLIVDGDYESYTWYHNGVAVSSGASESYTPGADTTGYYYAMVSKCGCDYITDTFYFDEMGIGQLDFQRHFRLYPNPTKDAIQLEIFHPNLKISASDIQVFNVLGQVQQIPITITGDNKYTMNLGALPAGTYHLQIRHQAGVWSQPVLKW